MVGTAGIFPKSYLVTTYIPGISSEDLTKRNSKITFKASRREVKGCMIFIFKSHKTSIFWKDVCWYGLLLKEIPVMLNYGKSKIIDNSTF